MMSAGPIARPCRNRPRGIAHDEAGLASKVLAELGRVGVEGDLEHRAGGVELTRFELDRDRARLDGTCWK